MWLRKTEGKGTEDATDNLTASSKNFQKGFGPESLALTTIGIELFLLYLHFCKKAPGQVLEVHAVLAATTSDENWWLSHYVN